MGWWSSQSYVSVAQRRAKAARAAERLVKRGGVLAPIKIAGRIIATTFWGKAWCENLESYSDFDNRLPRGRTYIRNGSVLDLKIEPGKIIAMVSGSSLYRITINIKPLPPAKWELVKSKCGGQIGSLIELLQGRLSKDVMEIVTRREDGIFPSPEEIEMGCSCPDWADMCKHLAAVLYGVGNRLDHQPELLFKLRQVDHFELIASIPKAPAIGKGSASKKKTIAKNDLAQVFGIELAEEPSAVKPPKRARRVESSTPPEPKKTKQKTKTKKKATATTQRSRKTAR